MPWLIFCKGRLVENKDNHDFVRLRSIQFDGIRKKEVTIEALRGFGMNPLSIIGLPDSWLKECRDKIKTLVSRYTVWGPTDRVLIQLFPPDLAKVGAHLELAIFLSA